jgi:FkbM family methyltransferase
VISFEPEIRNYSLLNMNVLINELENVVIENKALSDRNGSSFLYLAEYNKGDHRLSFVPDRQRSEVACLTLDEYLSDFEGDIHFLKSDTQGHELKILKGMQSAIRKNSDHLCCLMEFSPGLLESAEEGGLDEFLDYFDSYPAEIYWIADNDGEPDLVLVNKEELRGFALDMLVNREADYSKDLLLFFSSVARRKCFSEMGLPESPRAQTVAPLKSEKLNSKVVIAGCVRNAAVSLPSVLDNIETIAKSFDQCEVVICENDSVDESSAYS